MSNSCLIYMIHSLAVNTGSALSYTGDVGLFTIVTHSFTVVENEKVSFLIVFLGQRGFFKSFITIKCHCNPVHSFKIKVKVKMHRMKRKTNQVNTFPPTFTVKFL